MSQLTYLIDEICVGLEIYYTGRSSGHYLRTAFILCDDYTELTAKLFLVQDNMRWSDTHDRTTKKFESAQRAVGDALAAGTMPKTSDLQLLSKGAGKDRFKSYHDVLNDVAEVFQRKRAVDLPRLTTLQVAMKARRDRRNDFFHSTKLLDLSVHYRNCVEAFCDLLDYGRLLFGSAWTDEVCATRNLETLEIMLRLEKKNLVDPSVQSRVSAVLANWQSNVSKVSRRGMHVAAYPEDLHFRLCVIHGGQELRDKLASLL